MKKLIDLTGQKFGRWTVLSLHSTGQRTKWNCICDCGNTHAIEAYCLKTGKSTSCGCLTKGQASPKALHVQTGAKYGMLTIVKELDRHILPSGQKNRMFLCNCDCGNEKQVRLLHLLRGRISSCGCLQGEQHKQTSTKLYRVWRAMNQRCHKEYANEISKRNYQLRGITVCEEWQHSFLAFSNWAYANGYRQGLEIDRKDNERGYSADNCRWVTHNENANNKRSSIRITINGESVSLRLYLQQIGIEDLHLTGIIKRVQRGWALQEAINTPFRHQIAV